MYTSMWRDECVFNPCLTLFAGFLKNTWSCFLFFKCTYITLSTVDSIKSATFIPQNCYARYVGYLVHQVKEFRASQFTVLCVCVCGLPINSSGRIAGDVVDESYVSLVQLQGQWIMVLLIQQNAIVFICGHLESQRNGPTNKNIAHHASDRWNQVRF